MSWESTRHGSNSYGPEELSASWIQPVYYQRSPCFFSSGFIQQIRSAHRAPLSGSCGFMESRAPGRQSRFAVALVEPLGFRCFQYWWSPEQCRCRKLNLQGSPNFLISWSSSLRATKRRSPPCSQSEARGANEVDKPQSLDPVQSKSLTGLCTQAIIITVLEF